MGNALDHALACQQVGIGKGRVGEPPTCKPGAKEVEIRAAVFFDGTKNNRSNTLKRLRDPGIIATDKGKDDESSYANFYSNVSIMEQLNAKRDPGNHEVSVYVEGIGTSDFDFSPNAVQRNEDGKPVKGKNGKPIPLTDATNGNDDTIGYAIGSGETGITRKVDRGIKELRAKIAKAYLPDDGEIIGKLIIDVVGFSRGAAAARHFVHRRLELELGPGKYAWPNQPIPEIEINFVGLFDTVSSYERLKGAALEAGLYVESLKLVPVPVGPFIVPVPLNPHQMSTDEMFGDDVLQLHLAMGKVPKRVVHLAAADEYRENFSLTNINTSIAAQVGFEVTLPGVHSDIGGGYVEPNARTAPGAAPGSSNKEVRRIRNDEDERWLIEQGWYTPDQIKPWREYTVLPAIPSVPVLIPAPWPLPPVIVRTPPVPKQTLRIWKQGERSLTNEYQYVPLTIMLDFAGRPVGKAPHKGMTFKTAASVNAAYQVPAALQGLCAHFLGEAKRLDGQGTKRPPGARTQDPQVTCRSLTERNWLRNKYLHRSARAPSEIKIGMAARLDGGRDSHRRLLIPDDVLHEKAQDALLRKTKEKAREVKHEVEDGFERFKRGAGDLFEQAEQAVKQGAEKAGEVLKETGKVIDLMPPPILF